MTLCHIFVLQLNGPLGTYLTNNNITSLGGFVYMSGFISTLIAIERCVCVTKPFTAKKLLRTEPTAIAVIFVGLILVSLCAITLALLLHGLLCLAHLSSPWYCP